MAPFSAVPNGNGCNTGVDMRAFASESPIRPCSPRNPAEMVATLVWIRPCFCFRPRSPLSSIERVRLQHWCGYDRALCFRPRSPPSSTERVRLQHWRGYGRALCFRPRSPLSSVERVRLQHWCGYGRAVCFGPRSPPSSIERVRLQHGCGYGRALCLRHAASPPPHPTAATSPAICSLP